MTQWHRHRGVQTSKVHGGSGKADFTKLYNSRQWRAYSARFRGEHPLCCRCEASGRFVPTQVTDHIVPHRGNLGLFWDTENHQALCKRCHDQKSAREDGGGARNLPGRARK